jgi:uncharacterized SAM-binding protein YcdF (DUF218 family)
VFYFLSKIFDLLAAPLTWVIVLVAIGLLRRPRDGDSLRMRRALVAARFAPVVALFVLIVFSLEPVANRLVRSLEEPRISSYSADKTYDVVVLLGGLVNSRASATAGEAAFQDAVERMLITFDLLRSGRAKFAIISTGDVDQVGSDWVEARVIARQLRAWGIAEDRILVEDASRNTRENALFSEKIIRERGFAQVLIVTSAFHMRRALGCFEAVGLHPDALSTDFHSFGAQHKTTWLPRASFLSDSTSALREWMGRFVYRVRGYSTR